MSAEASRRIGHAVKAIHSIQRYSANTPLMECLSEDLIRSAVQRQLGIVQEALRVALREAPSMHQTWPELDSLLEACARMRDWQHPVAVEELVGFVAGDLQAWQTRLVEGDKQQQEEGAKLDQQIAENLRRLGYEQ
ncbi:MAG: hypothetical protein ACKO6F_12215 [Cyanobium sp.]